MKPIIDIDMKYEATARWDEITRFKKEARSLIRTYLDDIKGTGTFNSSIVKQYEQYFIDTEIQKEITGIAKLLRFTRHDVLLANLYYDVLKLILGCSTFAIETPLGPMHARNLDWYSDSRMLDKFTCIQRFKNGKNDYLTIGWPGFIGALSGMVPGKFAITLNAVSSHEKPGLAPPVTFLIRKVLQNAKNFTEAVDILSSEPILSDCLLLLSGCKNSEMVVIERTPSQARQRWAKDGYVAVTNNYLCFKGADLSNENPLHASTCKRLERMEELLKKKSVTEAKDCFAVLNDTEIKMDITMQQMVFQVEKGEYWLG